MKLTKLLEVKIEADRFNKRLDAAIKRATENDSYFQSTDINDGKKKIIPEADRDCLGTKESAALKRASTDLKMALYDLNKD